MIRVLLLAVLLVVNVAMADDRRTGYDDMAPDLRAMQDAEIANPGLFWVLEGKRLYAEPAGEVGRACTDCHGPGEVGMLGVAARYPVWDDGKSRPIDLTGRIDECRSERQRADPLVRESDAQLALTAYVTHQSRGQPLTPEQGPLMDLLRNEGRGIFESRMGQLNLACAHCHDDYAGERLAAAIIPQAHPTGYPQYRIQWETMGSLHRRFGNCMAGVRAKLFDPGSRELVALEAFLKGRAAGLSIEALPIRP